MNFSDLARKRVVIWGFGQEGRAVAEYLTNLGIPHAVAIPEHEDVPEPRVLSGDPACKALLTAEIVIKSPGVPVTSDLYRELTTRGVAVTSLTDLWMSENAERTVAVTGTKGKSTTASLITHVLRESGISVSLRGNIGTSVLDETDPPSDIVVMELSSYQAQSLTVSPRVLVVTSLFPEHLTWHGSEEAYYSDKLNAAAHEPEVLIAPGASDDLLRRLQNVAPAATLLTTGEEVFVDASGALTWRDGTRIHATDLPLLGRHQAENAALAALTAAQFKVSTPAVERAIRSFTPLPYRMERVSSTDGRVWIDDSLATAPEAVVASLKTLSGASIAVLIGGADRFLDFTPLVEFLSACPQVVPLLVGPAGMRIYNMTGVGKPFDTFGDALTWARSDANTATIVLLSPGAPSFDEFKNYEQRSAAFRAAAAR